MLIVPTLSLLLLWQLRTISHTLTHTLRDVLLDLYLIKDAYWHKNYVCVSVVSVVVSRNKHRHAGVALPDGTFATQH